MNNELQHIDDTLVQIIGCARRGEYSEAASLLNRFIIAFQAIEHNGEFKYCAGNILDKLLYSLETVYLMLEQKDWVAIADVIEFEFLLLWRKLTV